MIALRTLANTSRTGRSCSRCKHPSLLLFKLRQTLLQLNGGVKPNMDFERFRQFGALAWRQSAVRNRCYDQARGIQGVLSARNRRQLEGDVSIFARWQEQCQ